MNKLLKISLICFSSLFINSSCSEDYLDVEPTEFLSAEQVKEAAELNPDLLGASVRGLYTALYQTGLGGLNNNYDFGHRGIDLLTDMLSGDMALGGITYSWYAEVERLRATTDFTDNINYMPWRYYYRIILFANQVIDASVDEERNPLSDDTKEILGQAKYFRAFAYFYLANIYSNEYAPTQSILPLYTTVAEAGAPLSTTQEIYDQIIKDLESSKELLKDFNRGDILDQPQFKSGIDLDVINGLLSYVYLTTGQNDLAEAACNAVLNQNKYSILPMDELTSNGFNNVATSSWIWGTDLTNDTDLGLTSWWGQVDVFSYSYASVRDTKVMDTGLFAKIRNTDERKAQFPLVWGHQTPINKFYDPNRKEGTQRTILTDYVYMRIEELYLNKAEALARQSKDSEARMVLKELVSKRDTEPSYIDTLSGQALLDEIHLQIKIELWGEGKSYLAMKRYKSDVVRKGHFFENITLPYNDDRLTFEIPQVEVNNNDHIN